MNLNSNYPDQNQVATFLDLPSVVFHHLSDFLHVNDLRKLRLVCKTTSNWVIQSPKCLYRLPIFVDSSIRVQEVSKSYVGWTNLEIYFPQYPPIRISPVLNNVCHSVKKIRIHGTGQVCVEQLLDIILELGPGIIESFSFQGSLAGYSWVRIENMYKSEEKEKILKRNLEGLKILKINPIKTEPMQMAGLHFFLAVILRHCPNLETLYLPLTILSNEHYWEEITLTPLHDYLKGLGRSGKNAIKLSRIEFWSDWFYSDETINEEEKFWSGLSPSILLELVKLSHPLGIKLFNVPVTLLPKFTAEEEWSNQETWMNICVCIGSVLLKDVPSGFKDIYLPPGCRVGVNITYKMQGDSSFQFHLPDDVEVFHIRLNPLCYRNHRIVEFVDNLRRKSRPTVSALAYKFKRLNTELETLLSTTLSRVFPNLTKLVTESIELEMIGRMLDGLWFLEDLTLKKCSLGDTCFGPQGGSMVPVLLQMKNLKHLKLIDCDITSLSAYTFQNVFRFLRLKTFIFTIRHMFCAIPGFKPVNPIPHGITFWGGMTTLTTVPGRLIETLEYFEIFAPRASNNWEMAYLLSGFKNLKKATIHYLTHQVFNSKVVYIPLSNTNGDCGDATIFREDMYRMDSDQFSKSVAAYDMLEKSRVAQNIPPIWPHEVSISFCLNLGPNMNLSESYLAEMDSHYPTRVKYFGALPLRAPDLSYAGPMNISHSTCMAHSYNYSLAHGFGSGSFEIPANIWQHPHNDQYIMEGWEGRIVIKYHLK